MKHLIFTSKDMRDAEMRVLQRYGFFCKPSFTASFGQRRYHIIVVKVSK